MTLMLPPATCALTTLSSRVQPGAKSVAALLVGPDAPYIKVRGKCVLLCMPILPELAPTGVWVGWSVSKALQGFVTSLPRMSDAGDALLTETFLNLRFLKFKRM